jgi:hypothetical protein
VQTHLRTGSWEAAPAGCTRPTHIRPPAQWLRKSSAMTMSDMPEAHVTDAWQGPAYTSSVVTSDLSAGSGLCFGTRTQQRRRRWARSTRATAARCAAPPDPPPRLPAGTRGWAPALRHTTPDARQQSDNAWLALAEIDCWSRSLTIWDALAADGGCDGGRTFCSKLNSFVLPLCCGSPTGTADMRAVSCAGTRTRAAYVDFTAGVSCCKPTPQ